MNRQRVMAIFRRHYYATLHSPARVFDWLFWPIVDIIVWGFLTAFLQSDRAGVAGPFGFLLGGVLVWDLLFRSKNGIALTFLEEAWGRNVINVLVSPVEPAEYLAGAVLWAMVRLAVGWVITAILALVLFAFNVFDLGLVLPLLAAALVLFGLALSLVVLGFLLRFGYGADILAWAIAFMVMPVSAVYYPVSILPGWAQAVAASLPTAHVFEAMRTVLGGGATPWDRIAAAFVLDAVYLALALAFARAMFATLRRRGFVTRYM
jgi:ABC-2 type transport system permease protein